MKLDIKKISPTPQDKWDALELLIKTQQNLIEALFIMDSAIEYNTEEYREIHEKNMKEFIEKFEK